MLLICDHAGGVRTACFALQGHIKRDGWGGHVRAANVGVALSTGGYEAGKLSNGGMNDTITYGVIPALNLLLVRCGRELFSIRAQAAPYYSRERHAVLRRDWSALLFSEEHSVRLGRGCKP